MKHQTLICATAMALLYAPPVYADTGEAGVSVDRQKLLGLARSFVDKVGGELKKAEVEISSIEAEIQPKSKNAGLSIVPNGTELLFQLRTGGYTFNVDIYALKENDTIYLSLADIIRYFELAVDYDEEKKTASGWFLREDWKIEMDLKVGTILSRGEEYSLADGDIIEDADIVFIRASVIEEAMGMHFDFDTAQQYIELKSEWPIPALVREERKKKRDGVRQYSNEAELPRLNVDRSLMDINTVNANLLTRFSRSGDTGKTTRNLSSSVAGEGQLLYQDAYALANFQQDEGLRSFTGRLSRQSENQDLLGPLGATSYALGDIQPIRVPLLGSTNRELGLTVTNSPISPNNFETTEIFGDAIPGWDVELYRNGILVGSQEIDERAQYKFDDVPLFAGDNLFEVLFYGPMGEIRKDTVSVPVNQEILSGQDGTYEISATLTDRELYLSTASESEDKNTPHIAAKYNKFIGNSLVYGAFRSREVDGDKLFAVGTGATYSWGGALFNLDLGVDQDLNAAVSASGRKKINDWDLLLTTHANSSDYKVDDGTFSDVWGISGSAQRRFKPFFADNANFIANMDYSEDKDGNSDTVSRLGLNAQFKRLNVSNTMYYREGDIVEEELDNTFSARYRFKDLFLRGSLTYDLKPTEEISDYSAQIQYAYNDRLNSDLQVSYNPVVDYTQGRLNLNYRSDYFTTSPFIQLDSEDQLYAGINLNFTAIDTPYMEIPEFSAKRLLGQGYVSSFVYHDKNGNMCYDADDEVLPDVVVRSLNVKKSAATDKHGLSLISGLTTVKATDIVVDESTLPDPFMMSSYEGVSIFPKAGEIVELEFPIHSAAEVDGSLYLKNKNGKSETVGVGDVQFLSLDSSNRDIITASAAFDGFYVASRIPPGEYLMFVSEQTAGRHKASNGMPKRVNLSFEGDVLYGQDFEMIEGQKPVKISSRFVDGKSDRVKDNVIFSLKVKKEERSALLSLLDRLAKKRASVDLYAGLSTIYVHDDFSNDNARYTVPDNDMETAYSRCQEMLEHGISCEMEVLVYNTEPYEMFETALKD